MGIINLDSIHVWEFPIRSRIVNGFSADIFETENPGVTRPSEKPERLTGKLLCGNPPSILLGP
jgi:hypothetical protein